MVHEIPKEIKTSSPRISIALPLYNGAHTITAAVRSILDQTYPDWELLIMDDGSTDQGLQTVQRIADGRIRIFSDSRHQGISHRLNQAMDQAKGYYLARMDADDIAFPHRLEKQLCFLEENPQIDLLATGMLVFHSQGDVDGVIPVRKSHEEICCAPWQGFHMAHPTWFGRLQWFRNHRYRSSADGVEDQDLLYRSCPASRFACLPEVLLAYRQEGRSLKKQWKARLALLRVLGGTSLRRRQYAFFLRLLLTQNMKISADILFHWTKHHSLRNPLLPLPAETKKAWEQLFLTTFPASDTDFEKPDMPARSKKESLEYTLRS